MEYAEFLGLREIGFWVIFLENMFRSLQDIGPNASIKKDENGMYGFHFLMTLTLYIQGALLGVWG